MLANLRSKFWLKSSSVGLSTSGGYLEALFWKKISMCAQLLFMEQGYTMNYYESFILYVKAVQC